MGHKKGTKNKVTEDFNKAMHEYLEVPFVENHKDRAIKLEASRKVLHKCGAVYIQHKTGITFHDSHGADHVAKKQRPAFLDIYQQIYKRGPNYVCAHMAAGLYEDKDKISEFPTSDYYLNSSLNLGPRGINLGGCCNPRNRNLLPFIPNDRPGKIWMILCQDECCVHTLKEEGYCWLIPGVEMGDMPTKSDGEILHMSESDAEFGCGCLSLDGKIGFITLKELAAYIKDKHEGKNPKIPLHSSVHMHAGKADHKEGSWEGKHAFMHFELMCDQYDVLFNLEHRVPDPTKATASDVLSITDEERDAFKFGMAQQIDRSQGHLKRNHESHNTKNGKGMNCKPGGCQPHFRFCIAPLPQMKCWYSSDTTRFNPCGPNCAQCLADIALHGNHPGFQTCGKKGCDLVLAERGVVIKGKKRLQKLKELDEQPDWGVTISALQEMMIARGHFGLIGAACHAELAYKEHGWARLKAKVRPYVDGTMTKLEDIVHKAMQGIGQRARLEDSRKCREVMEAYRTIAKRGEVATAQKLDLWEKEHKKHRGVHAAEIAALLIAAGAVVSKRSAATIKRVEAAEENKKLEAIFVSNNKKRWKQMKRQKARKLNVKPIHKFQSQQRHLKRLSVVGKEASKRKRPKRKKQLDNTLCNT